MVGGDLTVNKGIDVRRSHSFRHLVASDLDEKMGVGNALLRRAALAKAPLEILLETSQCLIHVDRSNVTGQINQWT